MAEEHDQLQNVEVESNYDQEGNDEDFDGDDDFLRDLDFSGINNDDIPLNFNLEDDDYFGPSPGFEDRFFRKVDEVAQPATEIGDTVSVLKTMPPSSRPMEDTLRQKDVFSGIPPLDTAIHTSAPSSSNPTQTQTSLPPVKRRRLDLRQRMFIPDQAPPVHSTVTTTTITAPHVPMNEGPSTTYEVGGSSVIPEYSPTRPSLEDVSLRLARHLAQHSPEPSSRGKGISIEEGRFGDDDSDMSKLKEEIGILKQQNIEKDILIGKHGVRIAELEEENALKTKQIYELQTNFGSLIAFYFNLKDKLYEAFGDKLQSLF